MPLHNLNIMNKKQFAALFQRPELQRQRCAYYGTFKVHVCGAEHLTGRKAQLMNFLMNGQLALNMLFRLVLGKRGAESHWSSPYLIYIGTKTR
jgi:hypothetical protein